MKLNKCNTVEAILAFLTVGFVIWLSIAVTNGVRAQTHTPCPGGCPPCTHCEDPNCVDNAHDACHDKCGNPKCTDPCFPNCDSNGNCLPLCDPKDCLTCSNGTCVTTCTDPCFPNCDGNGNCLPKFCDPMQCLTCDGSGNCVTTCPTNTVCDGHGCCEGGPHYSSWSCCQQGTIVNPGTLNSLSMTTCVGHTMSYLDMPGISGTVVSDGFACRNITFDCPSHPNYQETNWVSYGASIYWEPTPTNVLGSCGSYAFAAKVKAIPSDPTYCSTNGPTTIGTFTVVVPCVSISPGSGWETCAGSTNTFTATATPGGGTYSWSCSSSNSASVQCVFDPATAGTNVVSVTYSIGGASCLASTTGVVYRLSISPASFVACIGTAKTTFVANAYPAGKSFNWSPAGVVTTSADGLSSTNEIVLSPGSNVIVTVSYGSCSQNASGVVANCACSTPLSDAEWNNEIHPNWPNIARCHTCKEANHTLLPTPPPPYPFTGVAYNCLAWTIGDTTRWWDIEMDGFGNGDGKWSSAELDAFYAAKGVPAGTIAYFGPDPNNVVHVAKKAGGPGGDCKASSKPGQLTRISHDLHEMEGGAYNNIVGGN